MRFAFILKTNYDELVKSRKIKSIYNILTFHLWLNHINIVFTNRLPTFGEAVNYGNQRNID